jgi:hypothetical protein
MQMAAKNGQFFYIGKSKNPHCFEKQLPNAHGFYYRNNKTAWMTAAFFEE